MRISRFNVHCPSTAPTISTLAVLSNCTGSILNSMCKNSLTDSNRFVNKPKGCNYMYTVHMYACQRFSVGGVVVSLKDDPRLSISTDSIIVAVQKKKWLVVSRFLVQRI